MKITLPNGIVLEFGPDDSVAFALTLIESLRGTEAQPTPTRVRKPKVPPVGTLDFQAHPVVVGGSANLAPGNLTDKQLEVWHYLVTHDRQLGIEIATVAEGLGLSYEAASWRLCKIADAGAAKKVSRGHYRAIANDPVTAN